MTAGERGDVNRQLTSGAPAFGSAVEINGDGDARRRQRRRTEQRGRAVGLVVGRNRRRCCLGLQCFSQAPFPFPPAGD